MLLGNPKILTVFSCSNVDCLESASCQFVQGVNRVIQVKSIFQMGKLFVKICFKNRRVHAFPEASADAICFLKDFHSILFRGQAQQGGHA